MVMLYIDVILSIIDITSIQSNFIMDIFSIFIKIFSYIGGTIILLQILKHDACLCVYDEIYTFLRCNCGTVNLIDIKSILCDTMSGDAQASNIPAMPGGHDGEAECFGIF